MTLRAFLARVRAAAREPGWIVRALRTGTCLAGPLAVGVWLGAPADGAVAGLGGFVGWYAHREPYRWRAKLLAGLGVALAVVTAAGTLAAPWLVTAAITPGIAIGLGAFVCLALDVAPPREYMLGLVCLVATGLPHDPGAWAHRAGLVLAGAAFAWLLTMSGYLRRRDRPERYLLAGAYERVADVFVDPANARGPLAAVAAVRRARHGVLRGEPGPLRGALGELDELLPVALGIANRGDQPEPARAARARETARLLRQRSAAAAAAVGSAPVPDELTRPPSVADQLRAAAGRGSVVLPTAVRIGLTVALAAAIGRLLHVESPYWVALTAAAALQGTSPRHSRRRALERAAGTAVGAALAAVLLALDPSAGAVVAAIALLQVVTELVIVASYGAGCVLLTPIPLLQLHLVAPTHAAAGFVIARVVDTAIGCGLALAALTFLWPRTATRRIADAEREGFAAFSVLLVALTTPGSSRAATRRARSRAQARLIALRSVTDASLGEPLPGGVRASDTAPGSPVERLLMFAIGAAPQIHELVDERQRMALLRSLEAIAGGLDGRPPELAPVPELPGMPRTTAELSLLATHTARRP